MTGYRDGEDALRARVEQLEGDLAGARAELRRLRGEEPSAPSAPVATSRIAGTPLRHERALELPFELTPDGYAAIARILRARLGVEVAQAGGDLSGKGFTLTRKDGRTSIRLERGFSGRGAGILASGFLAALFSGLPIAGLLADIANHGGPHSLPFHALWIVPSIVVGTGAFVRSKAKTAVAAEIAAIDGTIAAIEDAASKHALGRAKIRVGAAPADEQPEEEGLAAPVEPTAARRAES